MSHTISLALDGLSCGHCVKRVKEALEQRDDVDQADVTQQEAQVSGHADAAALIAPWSSGLSRDAENRGRFPKV